MLIRIRSTGAVMYENEFRNLYPNTSLPQQLTTEVLNEIGADPVLNGAQPTPTFYQFVIQDGVEEVGGQWFTRFICVDMDQEAKDAKDAQCKAGNKSTAEQKLQATDWTQVADVPLLNKQEFTNYRVAVRAIALNPPVQATFPDLPVEQWS